MNTKTIAISLSMIGGLVCLGLVMNHYIQHEPGVPDMPDEKTKSPGTKPGTVSQKTDAFTPQPPEATKHVVTERKPERKTEREVFAKPCQDEPIRLQVASAPMPSGDEFPLRPGSKGRRVERLQIWLMRNFGRTGNVTGLFDEQTQEQLKKRLNKDVLDEATYHRYKMGKHVNEQVIIR